MAIIATITVAPQISGLGLAMAAASGFSVGVWCNPDAYRHRNGSLTMAIVLIAAMWTVPIGVTLLSVTD